MAASDDSYQQHDGADQRLAEGQPGTDRAFSEKQDVYKRQVLALWGQPLNFANVFCVLTFIRYVSFTIV